MLTPGYPGIGQGEEGLLALREDSSALASVGVREVMDHLTGIVEDLDTPPIIMGHSFGGTFAQLLVGNGLGAAGVSIDSAAVKGINAMPLSEIRSVLPALKDPANLHRAVPLTPRQFHYAFTNTLSEEASQAAYDRYAAPPPPGSCSRAASRRSPRTPPPPSTSPTTTGPLLFISGGSDHILPPVVQRHNYEKNAKHSTAIAAHAVFAGRDHFTCGEPGWEAVADFALDWALAPVSGELVP